MGAAFHALVVHALGNLTTPARRGIIDFADHWKEWHRYSKESNRSSPLRAAGDDEWVPVSEPFIILIERWEAGEG
jgi:hypothetical protein